MCQICVPTSSATIPIKRSGLTYNVKVGSENNTMNAHS